METYWNGENTSAVRTLLLLEGDGGHPNYWAKHLIGTTRKAVRVWYNNRIFYLDDEDGEGWEKVTVGRGSPGWSHKSLYGREVFTR